MKTTVPSFLVCLALSISHAAQASVADFDDLDTVSTGSINVPHIYRGVAWGIPASPALIAINDAHWTGAGNYNNVGNGSPSGDNSVLNSGIVTAAMAGGGVFNFEGAYFAPFTSNNDMNSQASTATVLTVDGYNGATLVGSASMAFNAAGFTWLQADLLGITSLTITGTSPLVLPFQTRWAMDDFTFNQNPSPVPAPAAIWLFASALGAFGLTGRKKR